MEREHPRVKISRNMVIRHYIERGIIYSKMLEKAKETGRMVKIVEDE